jgi:hypothetical protein
MRLAIRHGNGLRKEQSTGRKELLELWERKTEMSKDSEFYDEIHKHLAENPEAAFIDKLTGVVMDALEKLEMRLGTLTPEQRKFAFHMLAVQAIGHVTYRMTEKPLDPVRAAESEYDCNGGDPEKFCPDCKRGWEESSRALVDPAKLRPVAVQEWQDGKMVSETRFDDDDTSTHPVECTCIFCIPGA